MSCRIFPRQLPIFAAALWLSAATTARAQEIWRAVPNAMTTPRDAHTALLLRGKVWLIGGRIRPEGTTTALVECYDPARKRFTAANGMVGSRAFVPAVVLKDGSLLVPGGFRQAKNDRTIADAERLSSAGTWASAGSLGTARELHTATILHDGSVLLTGGFSNNAILNTTELYTPGEDGFQPAAAMQAARFGHAAILLPSGDVMVLGGRGKRDVSIDTTEIYSPASGRWSPGPQMLDDRFRPTATLLLDGRILVTGGYSSLRRRTLETAEVYDPRTGQFALLASGMSDGRMDHTATLLRDGRVLLVGGWSSERGSTVSSADLFDPTTDSFTPVAPLPVSRHEQTATLLPDGSVLITGGLQVEPNRQRTLRDAYLFLP